MDNLTPEEKKQKLQGIVKAHCGALLEHFDSVQIFTVKNNKDEKLSTSFHWGSGNYFSRYGQVKQWVIGEEELTKREVS